MECVGSNTNAKPEFSPLMFSSDEEIDKDESDGNINESISLEDSRTSINVVSSRDERLVSQIQLVMTGIPPPPSSTIPKLDTSDILKLWKDNQHLITDVIQDSGVEKECSASFEEAKHTSWPEVVQIETFGVHYNKSKASEDLEQLCLKYKERFIGNETLSLCLKSPVESASAKKRARYRGWGHSPGRRLSHLARRRRAFTSANLQCIAGNNSGLSRDKKMILVETKKPNQQRNTKSRNSSTKKQYLAKVKTNLKNPKRALFQSPDEKPIKPGKCAVLKPSPNQLKIQQSKRALWPTDKQSGHLSGKKKDFNVNGKRGRVSSTPSPRKKCNRNLFSDGSTSVSSSSNKIILQSIRKSSPLSNPHQKKLLWAISHALKEEGIRMNNHIFRSCLSVLNSPCMALWIWKTAKETPVGSTSENMLAVVKKFDISNVIGQVQANLSTSNLMTIRLGLMKQIEAIKFNNTQNVDLKSKTSTVIQINECKTDKENISDRDNSVSESGHIVVNKSPLKDNNMKCDTSDNVTLLEGSSYSVRKFQDNSDESNSVSCDNEYFNGFDVEINKGKSIVNKLSPLNIGESSTVSFSELLSWNADPITRLQTKTKNFEPLHVNKSGRKLTSWNSPLTSDGSNLLCEKTDGGNSMMEYAMNDDETCSSSIRSFDLNNFVDDSRTCFEFSDMRNVSSTNMCSVEET